MTKRQMKPDPMKIPDPLELFPDPMRRPGDGERQSSASVPMFNASTAANVSVQGATGDGATVATPTEQPLTNSVSVSGPQPDGEGLTLATTKRQSTVTQCAYCGREFVARRPSARYCHPYCRRRAWLERNPEKAAELAAKDKARLRAAVIERGGEWVER